MEFDFSWKTISSISCHVIASGFFVILVPISYCIEVTHTLSSSDNVTNFFSISSFLVLRQKLKGPRKKACNTPWYIQGVASQFFSDSPFPNALVTTFEYFHQEAMMHLDIFFQDAQFIPSSHFWLHFIMNIDICTAAFYLPGWQMGAWLFSNNFCNYPWRSKLLSIMYSPSVIMITVPLFIIFPRWL